MLGITAETTVEDPAAPTSSREAFVVYTTCPGSTDHSQDTYRDHLIDVARWTEDAGHRGLLVYADNTLVDPWMVAHVVIDNTERAVPLVATQPAYAHPFTMAKSIASLAFLRSRPVDLNLVTGGFAKHLSELGDPLRSDHDRRYDRLIEYASVVRALLSATVPFTFQGEFYTLVNAQLGPVMASGLQPRLLISGASEACRRAAAVIGADRLSYPRPAADYLDPTSGAVAGQGIRLGIIARDTAAQAWRVAKSRFPADRDGERVQKLASRLTDSIWHRDLSRQVTTPTPEDTPYWMFPFRTYKTFCPYLIGSYQEVGEMLADYRALGVTTLILDVPRDADDLHHCGLALAALPARR